MQNMAGLTYYVACPKCNYRIKVNNLGINFCSNCNQLIEVKTDKNRKLIVAAEILFKNGVTFKCLGIKDNGFAREKL